MKNLSKAKLKLFTSLQLKKFRSLNGLYFIEGKKMLEEALQEKVPIEAIVYLESATDFAESLGIDPDKLHLASETDFKQLSTQTNPEGILAILPQAQPSIPTATSRGFFLDRIQDPGNLGTIIRTADWFGLDTVICAPGTVDCFNPKVLRSSMGSIFRVNVWYPKDFIEIISKNAAEIVGADLQGTPLPDLSRENIRYVLLGNEANGVAEEIRNIQGLNFAKIPGQGNAESLNVSISAGIFAYALFGS